MAFYGLIREQDNEIEMRAVFASTSEAKQLYQEIFAANDEWSPVVRELLIALKMASEKPSLH